ncbi:uncharacterized protein DEA37_0007332, partial [Paragonimus westermani]
CNREFVGEFTEEFGNSWVSTTYPEFAFCNWQITVDPGQRIYLNFSTVNVENTQLFGRFYDVVQVFDGPTCTSNIIGMFSGNTPMNFTSSLNHITVMLLTDDSLQDLGFVASYSTLSCGGEVVAESGNISTMKITGLELCIWRIIVPDDSLVTLNINFVHLHSSDDWFRVFDGPNCADTPILMEIGPSNATPTPLKSMTNEMIIVTVGGSLSMSYRSELTQCGGQMTNDSGVITSAGIEPYQLCVWKITVESDKRIILMVESVDLPTMVDWYRVLDGDDCLGKPIIYARGVTTEKPPPVKSTHNTVVFVTFGGKVKINYTSDCYGNFIGQPQGKFKSPLFSQNYPALSFCNWQVTANSNERLVIQFTQMDIENLGFNGHFSDCILLFDGPSCVSPMIGKITGNQPVTFLSSANHLSAMFISDDSAERTGFVAEFFASSVGSARIDGKSIYRLKTSAFLRS